MAVSAGVNFFDTADNYGLGESERRLGRAFKSRRDAVVIATKGVAWFRPLDRLLQRMRLLLWPVHRLVRNAPRRINVFRDQRKRYDYTPEHLTRAVEASLRRLATDYIDLYQLYNPGWDDLLALQVDALAKLQQQGKIRHFGISVDSVTDALGGAAMSWISAVQLPVSALDTTVVRDSLPRAQELDLGVIARAPLAHGLLTNAPGEVMADRSSHLTASQLDERRMRARRIEAALDGRRTLAQTALRYAMQLPQVSVAIPSAVNRHQLRENLGAMSCEPLSPEEIATIERN
jgi:aryl-alcohol dehydrogenase-like predicted oxidoreductase